MADDPKQTGKPADFRINVGQQHEVRFNVDQHEVRYWAEKPGVSDDLAPGGASRRAEGAGKFGSN